MWKFRNMPLNNPCFQEEITIKIRKYFGLHEMNENVMYSSRGRLLDFKMLDIVYRFFYYGGAKFNFKIFLCSPPHSQYILSFYSHLAKQLQHTLFKLMFTIYIILAKYFSHNMNEQVLPTKQTSLHELLSPQFSYLYHLQPSCQPPTSPNS